MAVDHHRPVLHREGLGERARDLRLLGDREALGAERAGPDREIGVGQLRRRLIGPAGVADVVMHRDRAVAMIVRHHEDRRDAVLHRRRDLIPGHQRPAVAGEGDHLGARPTQAGGHRHRQPRTHGADDR